MRKFLAISLLALGLATDGYGCGGGAWTYNYYLFSVFNRERMNENLFRERLDVFWKNYTNGLVDGWQWHQEDILSYAEEKGDGEMQDYLKHLSNYLEISDQLQETWSYPTKEQLQERQQMLRSMIRKADDYQGSRLKAQWMLLRMRAQMVLGNHQDNIDYWLEKGSTLPASVYRDMMENIYAGALMKTGRRNDACNIFAAQGDLVSMKWGMRKFRNVAGIQTIYQENPNMPTLNYLVQDFVNNAQETLDTRLGDSEDAGDLLEWIETIGARFINYPEVMRFTNFANQVIVEGKTDSPALWQAAVGELQFLYGHHDQAVETLTKAMKMDGTQRMKDNARAIRLVASAGSNMFKTKKYQKWVVGEMKWLREKAQEEGGYYNHYREVMARLVYTELVPRYKEAGQKELAAALLAMYNDEEVMWGKRESGEDAYDYDDSSWNSNYSSDFYIELTSLSGEEMVRFISWMKQKPKGELEAWARRAIPTDEQYYYDLVGTRYLAEGRFAEAEAMLAKVSPSFMEKQNISYYLANRDYAFPRWLGRQKAPKGVREEGAGLGRLTDNPKLRFCKEMQDLESQYRLGSRETKEKVAYELAVRYYQASIWGDCWYLTHYGWSSADTVEDGELDYVGRAVEYLEVSRQSSDLTLCKNSLYALAFIPLDPWCEIGYDWKLGDYVYTPLRAARQYKALDNLDMFMRQHPQLQDRYTTKCDVLKCFRKNR